MSLIKKLTILDVGTWSWGKRAILDLVLEISTKIEQFKAKDGIHLEFQSGQNKNSSLHRVDLGYAVHVSIKVVYNEVNSQKMIHMWIWYDDNDSYLVMIDTNSPEDNNEANREKTLQFILNNISQKLSPFLA